MITPPDNFSLVLPSYIISAHINKISPLIKEFILSHCNTIILVVLEGGRRYYNALAAELPMQKHVKFITAKSYYGKTHSSGTITVSGIEKEEIAGKEVLILDDMYDSGLTLHHLIRLVNESGAKTVSTSVLFEKQRKHEYQVKLDFPALIVPDKFLIGFGLDYQGKYRELDDVWAANSEFIP